MGITGLLPFVKNSCRPANIKYFSGANVAIDAYSWLHKGAFSCAEKLVKGEKTDGYVYYCIKQINLLLEAGLKPVMVFDGCNLSSKEVTEKKRRESREKTRQRGKELLCEGKIKEARECFQRCVDVTPEMAREVIEACRKKGIDCIVAPYEADAQLAYLDKVGMVQLIITEDSDLILFGCNKIFFKMDGCGGGLLYEKENLPKSLGSKASKFSFEKFRYMCILSGCDYLPSLPGIGLAKACKFFTVTNNMDVANVLPKLPCYLKMPRLTVPGEYIESFIKANNTFLYQLVFCPQKKTLVPLNPYPEDVKPETVEYAGKYLPDDLACQLAMGNINVKTMEKFGSSTLNSSPTINEDKSMVWGSQPSSSKISNKTAISAFKFSTPNERKKKVSAQKRSFSQTVHCGGEVIGTDEELFSMYGSKEVKKRHLDSISSEEDPLADENNLYDSPSSSVSNLNASQNFSHSKILNTPLQKIVKSRFFASESKVEINSPTSASEDTKPKSEIFSADVNCDKNPEVDTNILTDSPDLLDLKISSKKYDKENIIHRFAKKRISDVKQDILESSCGDSPVKNELKPDCWLNIIDSECSSATSTVSSTGKSSKLLDVDCSAIKCDINKTVRKNEKISKKLISTKIEDFRFKKDLYRTKLDNSLGSEGNSFNESLEECFEVEDGKSNVKFIISPYFNSSVDINQDIESEDNMTILSDSEECSFSNCPKNVDMNDLESKGTLCPKISQKKTFKIGNAKSKKLNRCRSLGLSKNRKICDKITRKETLLNFNFVRQPKKDISADL